MRHFYRVDIKLTLLGPVLTRGGVMPKPGIDAPVARNHEEVPILPFSLVKGKVLESFRDLFGDHEKTWKWFGKKPADGCYDPIRGQLRFTDFVANNRGNDDGLIERIKIDNATQSVEPRMLAVLEAPYKYGEEVEFQGAVEFEATSVEAETIAEALDEAFRWTPSFGSMRTVGFGRTHRVETGKPQPQPWRSSKTPELSARSAPFRLTFDRPVCFVGVKHSGNHFRSLECVPGAVLKGAVARLILERTGSAGLAINEAVAEKSPWPDLCRNFEHIRFSEARPMAASAQVRPVVPPLSVVVCPTKAREDLWYDVALESETILIDENAPAFEPDFKKKNQAVVRKAFGWPDLEFERRVRTAIDPENGRALDESLFSYDHVRPFAFVDKAREPAVWEGTIGLELKTIPDEEGRLILEQLTELLAHGLPCVGKSRATAKLEWISEASAQSIGEAPVEVDGERYHVVTLQTECLMTDPNHLLENNPNDLEKAYKAFWEKIAYGAFEQVRFFAKQELHGGYLAQRSGRKTYKPLLVTRRGSTFVLKVVNPAKANEAIGRWRQRGLDVPEWVETAYAVEGKPIWATCPFLPHTGFGEVAIDLACHTANRFGV